MADDFKQTLNLFIKLSIFCFSGVWASIRSPVTKEILFQVVEVERYMPPQKKPSELMPPPAKMPRR